MSGDECKYIDIVNPCLQTLKAAGLYAVIAILEPQVPVKPGEECESLLYSYSSFHDPALTVSIGEAALAKWKSEL